jgi:hypothetical protein
MLNDEGSVKGKGPSILLPPRGNPFNPDQPPPLAPSGGETEPRDLSPEDVALMFGAPAPPEAQPALSDEQMMSFSSPALAALEESAETPASFGLPMEPGPTQSEEEAARNPSSHAERGDEGAAAPPGAQPLPDVSVTPPAMTIPTTTMAGGQALPGLRAFGSGLQISENVGIGLETYKPGEALKADEQLLGMLVPDGRLVTTWTEIDALESQIAATRHLSQKGAADMLDRLAAARNLLMNDRQNFEEAQRLVAEVRFRLEAIKRSRHIEHAEIILFYLLLFLIALVAGLLASGFGSLGKMITGQGTPSENLIWTILIGGVGGVTGALYGLWTHVARDRDYDPQFALWYYSNPIMGLLMGLLAYFLVQVGVVAISGGQNFSASPYTMWILAFAVGFQQNLALSLLNAVLKRIIPQEGKTAENGGAGGAKDTPRFPKPQK